MGQNKRLYHDSFLNITKLLTQTVKQNYFRHIFNTQYNMGFGSPRTDIYLTCLQLTEKIKCCTDQSTKTNLVTKNLLHKMKAETYYSILKDAEDGVGTYFFHCQKNQISTVTCFRWTKNEFSNGSTEIVSCLYHLLNSFNFRNIYTIRLMCDKCGD
ncbi:hypothetical protein RN001_012369 [Aquatica leii]|uniref:Uncharacterized protein n=1 Tax=Aquatica leii TaxID=1421715 RepID=A0AAN7PUA5_9COLE|nr:hypothetical protein RN001_012369 [Aquatica leii]